MVGISDPYEESLNPEAVCQTDKETRREHGQGD
jgi:adenylylsulfate kinase-like enzyme